MVVRTENNNGLYLLALILICLTSQLDAGIIVQLRNETQVNLTAVEIVYIGSSNEIIDSPISLEISTDINQADNHIFLIKNTLAIDNIVLQAQENGAQAVLSISPVYFVAGYLRYRIDNRQAVRQISIPVFELPVVDGEILWSLSSSDQIVNITILPGDGVNQWTDVFYAPAFYLIPIFFALFGAANIGLIIWKMKVFIEHYGGFRSSVALYVLSIELVSNLIRLVANVDLFGSWGIYTEQAYAALIELSFPFAISSYMLFTLFWHEMMTNATVIVHPFIVKMKIPFFALAGLLLSLHLIRIILRNVNPFDNLSWITAIAYLLVLVAMVAFYSVTGVKLLIRINKSKHLGRTVNLLKTTVRILISGGFLIAFVAIILLFVARIAYRTPIAFVVTWVILFMLLDAGSMSAILAFKLPSGASSKSSGKGLSVLERKKSHISTTATASTEQM